MASVFLLKTRLHATLQQVPCSVPELYCGEWMQGAEDWTSHTPDCLVFTVLLLKCLGDTLQKLLPQALSVISAILQNPDR